MSKKQNHSNKPKAYEEGWSRVSSHHLLGAIIGAVKLYPLEDNSPVWENVTFVTGGFGYVKVYKDYRAEMYIKKNNKFQKEEWAFVFATLAVYLGLSLYKKYDAKNLFIKQGIFLFAMHYVKNTLGFQDVPDAWVKFLEIENKISFKNESSVIEQLKNEPTLIDKIKDINFLNNHQIEAIEFKNETGSLYSSWQSNKEFGEVFIDNLIEQAQRTIALRSNRNLTEEELEKKNTLGYKAKHWFEHHFPLLAALSASFKIVEDIQLCKQLDIQIAAVSAIDKTIYINPLARLNEMGTRFVIAHEILHVALDHARRRAGRDPLIWNLACDFVINHWLVEMNIGISPSGLFFDKELSTKSADEIYLMIASDVRLKKKLMTLKDMRAGEGNSKKSCDMLDQDPSYFAEFADACKEALLRGVFMHQSCGRGDLPADLVEEIKAINQPVIPWQVELADWIAQHFPLEENRRSYARPSRRQSSTPDIPRPAYIKPTYEKKTRTFGVILDTSGSMDKKLLGKCLGAIASYSQAQEVKEIRLIFCDAQPYDEGFVPVELLAHKMKVKGRGGTVLQQAVNYLQNCLDFPDNAPILILTDGFFEGNLTVEREHAFLVPNKAYMPITAKNVFEFK
jgi:predicted metal-dependent peptidase